jgi:hypothetical protein
MPVQPDTNPRSTLAGREYAGHALDRMQEHGIKPTAVERTIATGRKSPANSPNEILYYDPVNNLTVITDKESVRVITVRYGKY